MTLGVFVKERAIWLGDADNLDVVAFEGVVEEAGDVAVREADNGDFEGLSGVAAEREQSEKKEAWHRS